MKCTNHDGPMFKTGNPSKRTFPLKNKQHLVVVEKTMNGMAGEPMNYFSFSINDEIVNYNEIKKLLLPAHRQLMDELICDLELSNEANANYWVR